MTLYGIKNCDAVRKARKSLEQQDIDFQFIDYKTIDKDDSWLTFLIEQLGIDVVFNQKSTTYRQLSDADKLKAESLEGKIKLIHQNQSILKRPLLQCDDNQWIIGFNEEKYRHLV